MHLTEMCSRVLACLAIACLWTPALQGEAFWRPTRGSSHGPINAIAIDKQGTVFAGSDSGWVHVSTDAGVTWTSREVTSRSIRSLVVDPSGWMAAGLDSGIMFSANGGASWSSVQLQDRGVNYLAGDGAGGIAAITSQGACLSSDLGATWKSLLLPPGNCSGLAALPGCVIAGSDSGLFSCENGEQWSRVGKSSRVTHVNTFGPGIIFVGVQNDTGQTLLRSTDRGVTWETILSVRYAGVTTALATSGSLFAVMVMHYGRLGGGATDFLFSDDLGDHLKLTATRTDGAPTAMRLHPSGRTILIKNSGGGG